MIELGQRALVFIRTGVAAPTTAVDDIAERFGRPRAHSFSRQDRHASLPALNEEDDGLSAYGMMEDRKRAVSMSAMSSSMVVEPRRWRPSKEVTTKPKTQISPTNRPESHRVAELLGCRAVDCKTGTQRTTDFLTWQVVAYGTAHENSKVVDGRVSGGPPVRLTACGTFPSLDCRAKATRECAISSGTVWSRPQDVPGTIPHFLVVVDQPRKTRCHRR